MRISNNTSLDVLVTSEAQVESLSRNVQSAQESSILQHQNPIYVEPLQKFQELDKSDETKAKVEQAVESMNEMLETTKNASKFKFHEGLDRYYVTVVDRETDEVVKEIPPKRLLDAFYEMQKMLGMIVDEKI